VVLFLIHSLVRMFLFLFSYDHFLYLARLMNLPESPHRHERTHIAIQFLIDGYYTVIVGKDI